MSTFSIYAFILVTVYVLYYVFAILWELKYNKNNQEKGTPEYTPEDAFGFKTCVVKEYDDGTFSMSGEQFDDYDIEVEQHEEPVVDDPFDEELLDQESQESRAAYESLKAILKQMEPVEPIYNDEYKCEDFAVMMSKPFSPKIKILRSYVNLP